MQHKFDPSVTIKSAILMSGVYNIADHYLHEASRAVENISPMKPAMHGNEVRKIIIQFSFFSQNFDLHSPTLLLKKLKKLTFPPIFIMHGKKDATVPFSSSKLFYEELKSYEAQVQLITYEELGHADFSMDLMIPSAKNHKKLVNDLISIMTNKI